MKGKESDESISVWSIKSVIALQCVFPLPTVYSAFYFTHNFRNLQSQGGDGIQYVPRAVSNPENLPNIRTL